eukprot:TRINITY_DN14312_c0_g1_i1.p1 TRINITY_DN14312_c0_g1~~TRINITY_DN14312_c0_g1_i1.p1  ORF type:complete len:1088 (-),score=142.80 TRINITY_DN14312_c0_g1_i1:193-3075(-)
MDQFTYEQNHFRTKVGFQPVHGYEGFRPMPARHFRQNTWGSGYQGELCPELKEKQLEVLENRYRGTVVANRAATVIQRAWREYILKTKFSRMVDLAKSVENISSRRLSLLEPLPAFDGEVEVNVDSGDIILNGLESSEEELAMGMNELTHSPAARHINSRRMKRQNGLVKRSNSLTDHRRSGSFSGFEPIDRPDKIPCHCGGKPQRRSSGDRGPENGNECETYNSLKPSNSWSENTRFNEVSSENTRGRRPQTAADLQNMMNQAKDISLSPHKNCLPPSPQASPVPPCPPLRGEDFYPEQEPLYFARDSLYCSVRRPRRLPPRPPQRSVSFLATEPPARLSALPKDLIISHQRPISVSDSSLPHPEGRNNLITNNQTDTHVRTTSMGGQNFIQHEISSHNRSFSSPDPHPIYESRQAQCNMHQKRSPLPPPPYVPPPTIHRDPNEPLPPPPTEIVIERPPCDSVSSIDSGFRSSCSESTSSTENTSVPTSPCQPFMELPEDPYSYWVGSPNILTSPDTAQFYRQTVSQESVYQQRPHMHQTGEPHGFCCENHVPQLNLYDTYQDVYDKLNRHPMQNQALYGSHHQNQQVQEPSKPKKSVRIQLPSEERPTEDDETLRRRQYRVGLNMFNTSPKRGIEYLVKKDFVEYSPAAVAKFLLGRKGLSKKMVGEYICDLQKPFNLAVLHSFVVDMDFSGLHLDIALRQLLAEVSIPGEAQKIEKLVEVFSKRYIECNQMFVSSFKAPDTIFILSYAMVLLNTDLHNKSIKPERKMKQEDFIRNLRGIDCGSDIDIEMVRGIYDRIKTCQFKQGSDHVSQVTKVQETILGSKRPKLNASWRRLVCFCRVSEVADMNKKEKKDSHQRGLFLFNDLLVVTKNEKSKKKQLHQHRYSLGLSDLKVNMFRTQHFQFGVQLQERHTSRIAATFACRSYNDQQRFVSDLQESIAEVEEMERARLFINESSMC